MYKPFIKNMPLKIFLGLLTFIPFLGAQAAQADFSQEVVIVAKRQASDLKNKVASYLEDVKITQGTLTIEADLVQVTNAPNSDEKQYVAKGKPAKFSQLLDDGQLIELQADVVTYSPAENTITIKGNASVSQEGSMVKGDVIIYNIATEQLTAESSETVTTILKPKTPEPIDKASELIKEQQ